MKFVGVGDIHSTSLAPAARVDNYIDELFDLLDQVKTVAIAIQARAILLPGDLFHSKERSTIEAVMRLLVWGMELRHERDIRLLTVPGNHDEVKNRYESIADQPIGWLYATGVFENVSVTRGEAPALLRDPDGAVAVWGMPWPDTQQKETWDTLADSLHKRQDFMANEVDAARHICIAHCFAKPVADNYYGDPVWAFEDLARTGHDLYVFAHDHSDNGAFELPSGQKFVNYGALCRVAANEYDLTRQIAIAVIDVPLPDGPIQIHRINLNARPATELFDLEKKAKVIEERQTIEKFVEALHTVDLQPLDAPDVVRAMGLAAEVERRVLTYIEDAE